MYSIKLLENKATEAPQNPEFYDNSRNQDLTYDYVLILLILSVTKYYLNKKFIFLSGIPLFCFDSTLPFVGKPRIWDQILNLEEVLGYALSRCCSFIKHLTRWTHQIFFWHDRNRWRIVNILVFPTRKSRHIHQHSIYPLYVTKKTRSKVPSPTSAQLGSQTISWRTQVFLCFKQDRITERRPSTFVSGYVCRFVSRLITVLVHEGSGCLVQDEKPR